MSKILIIGSSGLVGGTLVKQLSKDGHIIDGINRSGKQIENEKVYICDINDSNLLLSITKGYDILINTTGQVSNNMQDCFVQNTKGIRNIINCALEHKSKLIHLSTVLVYGKAQNVDENSLINPITAYGAMKGFAEFLIQDMLKDSIILRVCNVYGEEQKKGIVNYIKNTYLKNEKILEFNNNGLIKRYYIHVNDLANIISKSISLDLNGIYNILGPDELTIKEIIKKFETILDYSFDVKYTDIDILENIEYINNDKFKKEFKLKYEMTLEKYIKNIYKTCV